MVNPEPEAHHEWRIGYCKGRESKSLQLQRLK
jgi:hypothetical protein